MIKWLNFRILMNEPMSDNRVFPVSSIKSNNSTLKNHSILLRNIQYWINYEHFFNNQQCQFFYNFNS